MSQQDHPAVYHASTAFSAAAAIGPEEYLRRYQRSIEQPEIFWAEVAERIDWIRTPTRIKDVSFHVEDFRIRWFDDGELNVATNCIDRHLDRRGDKTAIIWEGDDPTESRRISYRELHAEVCRLANALRNLGV
ncbi:MAG TPA: acetyl-coenzyme A synthetase, partial [Xanthomonadales bacterium]|nr:acetyl-coenzyme A synthetase [Xanthomonadales bacterium]